MDDTIIMSQLIDYFKNKGYPVEHYTDIIKIKYDDNDISILKNALQSFSNYNYKKFVVRCFTQNKLRKVTGFLLDEFIASDNNDYRWVIGNALYSINDTTYEDIYIEIISNRKFKSSRQMIVLLLGKTKTFKSRCALVPLLNDYDVLPQVLKALKNNLDSNTSILIKSIIDDSNKIHIMSELKRLKEHNSDYKNVDLNGYWKLLQKEGKKTIDCNLVDGEDK